MEKDFRFLIYNSEENDISVNAVIKNETIWLKLFILTGFAGGCISLKPNKKMHRAYPCASHMSVL